MPIKMFTYSSMGITYTIIYRDLDAESSRRRETLFVILSSFFVCVKVENYYNLFIVFCL